MMLYWTEVNASYYIVVLSVIIAASLCLSSVWSFAEHRVYASLIRARSHNQPVTSWQVKLSLLGQDLLRNGVSQLRKVANILLRINPLQKWLLYYFESDLISASLECGILLLICTLLLSLLLMGNMGLGLLVFILFVAVMLHRKQQAKHMQQKLLLDSLPEALKSIGMCYSAGISLELALEQTAAETAEPLRSELLQASSQMKTGKSATEALDSISKEDYADAEGFKFALIALKIQHKTGGKLVDIIENAAKSLTESAELRADLRLKTAQSRLSAKVVAILPLALVAILSLVMPNYLSNLLGSSAGITILIVAAMLELSGIFIIRRILGVKV